MGKRKSIIAKEKARDIENKAAELKVLYENAQQEIETAEKEEKEKAENVRTQIDGICKQNEFFCGAILNLDDLLGLVKMSINAKDGRVVIPFGLYYAETSNS